MHILPREQVVQKSKNDVTIAADAVARKVTNIKHLRSLPAFAFAFMQLWRPLKWISSKC